MKIAIISLAHRLGGTTGDCVQANKTAEAIRAQGHDVLRCYLRQAHVLDEKGDDLGLWEDVLGDYDVVHAVPPIPWKFLAPLPKIRAKLVASTIFWHSWTCVRTIHKVRGRISRGLIKEYIRIFMSWLRIPSCFSYKGYDLLLPNSEDEIRNFKRFCKVKKTAKIVAIPNAIDPIPSWVADLPRPSEAPTEDYVVVPAVFADRKNQFVLIDALQGSSYKIVFMGDGEFLDECKARANGNMMFLGFVKHGSELFYGLLKYARVCCLPSNCETPGIAGLEAAALGVRPVVPYEGGTCEYYGWDAEYLDPLNSDVIRASVEKAWSRGRLLSEETAKYRNITWATCALKTLRAYAGDAMRT